MADTVLPGPVEGLRIVEIGDWGEIAGKLLADAGADVIRVEPPGGGRSRHVGPFVQDDPGKGSLLFAARNTSKRGVTLDVTRPDATRIWRALVADTDVVIDSSGPGVLDGVGLGYEAVGGEGTIWCSVTPYGETGPRREWASADLVQLALGGPMMSTGYEDHSLPPIRADGEHSVLISNEYAVSAILAAVLCREQSGRGDFIDLSVHEAVSATTEGAFPNWEYAKLQVLRQTGRHAAPVIIAPWQYQCADGQYVLLMGGGVPREKKIWDELLDWMDEHGLAEDLRDERYARVVYQDPLADPEARNHVARTIGRFVEALPLEEVYRRGQGMHLPWGPVRRPEQNLDDPHWDDRGFWWEGELPGVEGRVRYPGAPYRLTQSPIRLRRRPPLLGEHNTEVYGGLGRTAQDLAALAQAGVV